MDKIRTIIFDKEQRDVYFLLLTNKQLDLLDWMKDRNFFVDIDIIEVDEPNTDLFEEI